MAKRKSEIFLLVRNRFERGYCAIIDLVSISHAIVVAEQLSFGRAAKVLGVRQSAVSRRVQALEDALGVSLFERNANGIRVTYAGRLFIERAASALGDIDRAIASANAMGQGIEGFICIGIPSSTPNHFFPDLINVFRRQHPGVKVDFVESGTRGHIPGILARRVDIAFVAGDQCPPACDAELMWTSKTHVVMPADHPLAGCDILEWNYLISEHFIFCTSSDDVQRYRRLINSQKKRGGRPSIEYFEVSHGMLLRLVALGFGLSMIGGTYVPSDCAGIASRPIVDDDEGISYYAVWLPGNDNPALRRFLSLTRSMSAKKPAPKA